MSTMSIFDLTDTWNSAGTTFNAIKMNVTDTASAAGSLLLDLQVGGSSRFSVRKDGRADIGGLNINFGTYGGDSNWWSVNNLNISSSSVLSFGAADIVLRRDAANTLAQRNGVNAQAFRIYNTFTDASNYERLDFSFNAATPEILARSAGTGTGRGLNIGTVGAANLNLVSSNTIRWRVDGSGHFIAAADNTYDIGTSGANRPRNVFWAGYQEMSEMTAPAAPAANGVRIYAIDNGSGKTQLMALFATGAAVQIAIEP